MVGSLWPEISPLSPRKRPNGQSVDITQVEVLGRLMSEDGQFRFSDP